MNKVEKTTIQVLNSFAGIVLFLVSMAAFYMPYEWRILPQVQTVLTPVRYACGGLLIVAFFFLYASSLSVFRKNWALFAALGFVAVLVFSTVMHQGDLEGALGTYGLAGLFLVLNIAVFFRVNPKKYILLAFFLLLIVNIVNTWTVFRYWGIGMWEEYGLYRNTFYSLVGNYNGGIEYVMPMALCGSAWASRYGKWLDLINYPAMVMSLVMAIKCDSLTQIVAYAAILAFMIVGNFGMLLKPIAKVLRVIFQPVILMAVDFAVFISVILLNRTNWVARLGVDPDFHNRRHIWNMSMDWIKANPIWGSGQETVAQEAGKITGYAHSHCTYLEVAYKTGFVGIVFMLLMLAAAIVAIYRSRHAITAYFLSVLMFVFGLAAVAETYPMVYMMFCLGLIYYIAKTTNENEHYKDRIKQMRPVNEPPEDLPPAGFSDESLPPEAPEEYIEHAPAAEQKRVEPASAGQRSVTPTSAPQEFRQPEAPKGPKTPVQTVDVMDEELKSIGRKVREVQYEESPMDTGLEEDNSATRMISPNDISSSRGANTNPDLDETVHLDETVIIGKK